MSALPPLPPEDIKDGEIRVFTYRHMREYGAICRAQGRADYEATKTRVRAEAFAAGWRTAANWVERDDLIADIGSPAYVADRDSAIGRESK